MEAYEQTFDGKLKLTFSHKVNEKFWYPREPHNATLQLLGMTDMSWLRLELQPIEGGYVYYSVAGITGM